LSHALLASTLALAAAQTCAAPPDAGQISQEPRAPISPAAPADPTLKVDKPTMGAVPEGGPTVKIGAIALQGNTAFSTPALQTLLADALGREQTFADLSRLAERITRHYRDAGYLVARAYLPAQQLKDGVLDIAVLEGRLGQVEVSNKSGLKPSALAALQQLPLNSPLLSNSLEQTLLTLADLPGTQIQTTLRPGQAIGASDLLVEVSATSRFEGSADLDNFGSLYTGEYRAGTSLYWNNPLDRGDQLSLRLQASNDHLHYERLAYQLPVGTHATRIGVAVSNMQYRLGKDFGALDATGSARIASAYLRQGLLRSVTANWYGQLQFDAKFMHDEVGSTKTTTRQSLHNLVLGLNGDWVDTLGGGGNNALQADATVGRLSLDGASATLDAASARSVGNFLKLETALQRTQALGHGLSLAVSVHGQAADQNLPSVEKMSLGGSQGVRAYPQGEALGDSGWLASAELRWNVAPSWQLQAFGDAGGVKTNEQPWLAGINHRRLAGAGLGASWATQGIAVTLAAAWATDRESPSPKPDRQPRIWAQVSHGF
jgi:hemolysin activation/secretion protein